MRRSPPFTEGGKVYDAIFSKDPLLLEKVSRDLYGKLLLENLLIGRTALTDVPVVELHNAKKKQDRVNRRRPPPPKVRERYLQHRIDRTDESPEDTEKLELVTLVSQGEKTGRRLHNQHDKENNRDLKRFMTHQDASEDLAGAFSRLDQRLRIAAIGFRVKVSKLAGKAYLNEDLCMLEKLPRNARKTKIKGLPDALDISELGRTTRSPNGNWRKWVSTVCGHIAKAIDSGAQLVVLPELALPPDMNGKKMETEIRRRCAPPATKKGHDHFVFAGSRHEGIHNRGLLLHFKGGNHQPGSDWHYKGASARALGENIHGPASLGIAPYRIPVKVDGKEVKLDVTLAICYDSFDPTTFLSLVLNSVYRSAAQNRIILIPSFNTSTKFVELLRDLSFLTRCTVIYVNSLHGDARMFIGGFAIRDIFNNSGNSLVDQLKAKHASVTEQHEKVSDELRSLEPGTDSAALTRQEDKLRREAGALDHLLIEFEALQQYRGFEHLITVERCQDCEAGPHTDDYECASDILYYNIDVRLLVTLLRFHVDYLEIDQSFLPEPLRRPALEKAVKDARERWKKRAGR